MNYKGNEELDKLDDRMRDGIKKYSESFLDVLTTLSEMAIKDRRSAFHYISALFWIEWLYEEKTDYGGKAELFIPKELVDSWQSRDDSLHSKLTVNLHPQEDGGLSIELERHEIKEEEKKDGS